MWRLTLVYGSDCFGCKISHHGILKMECAKKITNFLVGGQWGVSISVMWVYILPEYTC
jgi:hypothetical protein